MGVPEKTLITGEEILEYIPQRPPVVMVDPTVNTGSLISKPVRRNGNHCSFH